MAQFLYLFEGVSGLTSDPITERGCSSLLPKSLKMRVETGPAGIGGMMAVFSGEKIGYYPEQQAWRRRSPGVWVGMWKDDRPTPEELAVEDQQEGHFVAMRDGRRWLCPMAREWIGEEAKWTSRVPAAMEINDNGEWIRGEVEKRYRRLWEIATAHWDSLGDSDKSMPLCKLTDLAVECLAVNYRIGRVEASLLGLFDDQGRASLAVLNAAVDLPTIEEWMKKKEPLAVDGLSSRDGAAA